MKHFRKMLTSYDISLKSKKIYDFLFKETDILKYKNICTYMSAFNEPDTFLIINELISNKKNICVPVTDKNTRTLSLSLINDMNLKKGAYNIYEPSDIIPVDFKFPEIILVPAIAFDYNKNRIGFGMGYYDKLLKECEAVKTGICYDFQLTKKIPAENHDIKMDMIITDKQIIM